MWAFVSKMAATGGRKRWNCPTDRELTLRAKLNSGWSVHTQDYFLKPDVILAQELRFIEEVLERAKNIDLLEKKRIEKLVCRLENMRRNAVGDGRKNCFMCGTAFGMFWNVSSNCADCSKAVCEKCRIDISISSHEVCLLCKICAENREVWKKSGGWFYGEVPAAVNCTKANNTWERKNNIVRLQSFKPPAENYNEIPLYKNWAANSSPDLSSLDEEIIFKKDRTRRKHSDSREDELVIFRLCPPSDPSAKLSTSCPSSLQELTQTPLDGGGGPQQRKTTEVKGRKGIFSRNRFLSPARRAKGKMAAKDRKST